MEDQKISSHFMVPKHEIVPKELETEVLTKFGIKKEQLPKLPKDDPLVAETGAERDDVVKITRESRTAGKAVYFRVVL
jgi:DNA-directed RNA polymerase subunit H